MRIALVNPPWTFHGSTFTGCKEPHLPLELGYARALLQRAGHEARIFDAQLRGTPLGQLRDEIREFAPELGVIATAPSYLSWRCPPPELRVPIEAMRALRSSARAWVAVGPHASVTPLTTMRKLEVDCVVLGDCEVVLTALAAASRDEWYDVPQLAFRDRGDVRITGPACAVDPKRLPALRWDARTIALHTHHHRRSDVLLRGPGAELEASRGGGDPSDFGAMDELRRDHARRPLETVLDELDALIAGGVTYVWFADEAFAPDHALLEALATRGVPFGARVRIDQWTPSRLDHLVRAGCVSLEARVLAVTEEHTELFFRAAKAIPLVVATLQGAAGDRTLLEAWRARLRERGVRSSEPLPFFPYPGSRSYTMRWGRPDDAAWERAHQEYVRQRSAVDDANDTRPLPLPMLEMGARSLRSA
jgi:B12-binding domain/radical SAM domain protein of rhizo-twelve system